jgi:hypothetical protein
MTVGIILQCTVVIENIGGVMGTTVSEDVLPPFSGKK